MLYSAPIPQTRLHRLLIPDALDDLLRPSLGFKMEEAAGNRDAHCLPASRVEGMASTGKAKIPPPSPNY